MRTLASSFLASWLAVLPACWAQDTAPPATPPPAPAATPAPAPPTTGHFKITFDDKLQPDAYSGRIYIALSKDTKHEPRRAMGDWFGKNPVFSMDVKDVAAGGSVELTAAALAFPVPLADVEPGEYAAQAIARRSKDSPFAGLGDGDLYSDPVTITLKPGDSGSIELKLSHVVEIPAFKETDRLKVFSIVSPSLSKFYGREMSARASVILPEGWKDDSAKQYPTVYFLGGFGVDYRFGAVMAGHLPKSSNNCLVIVPDPSCGLGYSAFADSANNGPRGQSLIEELMPAVEAKFHGAQAAERRFVSGISSGGWASLWLSITYPDSFAGCWSYCPDPVDFRDFQKIDLYSEHANMYKDAAGNRRPLARSGDKVSLYYDDFCKQEWVLGPGGQIHSFEAVFSPKGEDGQPKPLFDRASGNVNHDVAMTWEKYDIRLTIDRNWVTLGPKIKGKLHIYAGERDNFYLDGSARLLGAALKNVDPSTDFHVVKGMGHEIQPQSFDVMFRVLGEKAGG